MTGSFGQMWLEKSGRSEIVVDAMRESFPDAELVALWNDAPKKFRNVLEFCRPGLRFGITRLFRCPICER